MLVLKITFVVLTLAVFIFGVLLFKNFDTWLGPDKAVPSDNESATFLNKTQMVVLWLLAMKLLVMMVIIL